MTPRALSPIHAPLDPADAPTPTPSIAPPPRIALLASLETRSLSGHPHSLGPGGASALFTRAVQKALVDEMAEQLREGPFEVKPEDSDLRRWALEIIEAFEGEAEGKE
jgi:hypothetical protein